MWQAGRTILVVTPEGALRSNWVVRAYADQVFDSIDAMGEYLKEQQLGLGRGTRSKNWRPTRGKVR